MATLDRVDAEGLRSTLVRFSEAVHLHAHRLNLLNVYPVPDGDTGTNMARTLEAVTAELDATPPDLASTCAAISHGSLMGARGNSGVILSQILRAMTGVIAAQGEESVGPAEIAAALGAAAEAAYRSVLHPVEGTILTVVRESADAAQAAAAAGDDLVALLDVTHRAAEESLERTPELLPVLAEAGVVDAGAAGYVLLLEAALAVVDGRAISEPAAVPAGVGASALMAGMGAPASGSIQSGADRGSPRYEVMYFCDLRDDRIDEFKERWGALGDSIVVVGGDGLWNCHVHTDDIGGAVETALELDGRPHGIRVTDLFDANGTEQAQHEHGHDETLVTTAVVAVAHGDGLAEMFRSLGAGLVVSGGQTDNPSTAEILAAVDQCAAESVIVLPNNKNIIAVAQQAVDLARVPMRVVPTRSIPEGLAAMVVHDPNTDADRLVESMTQAAELVATGEVTQAVRASASQVGPIAQGDWIGLVRGDGVVAVADRASAAAIGLFGHLLEESSELVTLLCGEGATANEVDAVVSWIGSNRPDIAVEVHHGGQRLYPFIIGVE